MSVARSFPSQRNMKKGELGRLVLEEGEKDPYIMFIMQKYEKVNDRLDAIRPLIEKDAMYKAEEFVKTSLNNLDWNHSTAKGKGRFAQHIVRELNRRWSIDYEFAFIGGAVDHFTITGFAVVQQKERYTTSNVIVSREWASSNKSYAIIRKKKTNRKKNRHNPLYEYRRRWDLHKWLPSRPIHLYNQEDCYSELKFLPKRTRDYEARYCEGKLFSDWSWDIETPPPFIHKDALKVMLEEGKSWRVVCDDNSYSGSYAIVYAMVKEGAIMAEAGPNFSFFVNHVGSTVYNSKTFFVATESFNYQGLVSIEIDPLSAMDKTFYRNAWRDT